MPAHVQCPDESELVAFSKGELARTPREHLEAHLDACETCSVVLAELVRVFGPPSGPLVEVEETLVSAPGGRSDDHLRPGDEVSRYRILEVVGAGGMGIVYAAYDPELDRRVALKILRNDDGSSSEGAGRPRLQREAQALARLSHPNVVAVHDVGTVGDRLFLAMEFVDGQTLTQWLTERERSWPQIREVFVAAGRGLVAAHAAGVVHRDFKPDNVLIDVGDADADGPSRVRVTDFGLARLAGSVVESEALQTEPDVDALQIERLTQTGALLGTPAYMAPEQLEGGEVDHASDQYSFCVALYEALWKSRPFRAKSLGELIVAVRSERPAEPPRDGRVPSRVRAVIMRGLSRDPADRYESMSALLADLGRDPARAWRRAAVTAVPTVALGIGVAAYAFDTSETPEICDDDALARVWNPVRAESLQGVFESTGKPYADETWTATRAAVDDYVERWSSLQAAACQDVSRDVDAALRMLCLREHREHLAATLTVLGQADAELVGQAPRVAEALPDLGRCEDPRRISALAGRRPPPEIVPPLLGVRARLAGAETLLHGGDYDGALQRVDALTDEVEALSFAPLSAELRLWRGRALSRLGRYEEGRAELQRAAELATEAGDRELTADALIELLFGLGQSGNDEKLGKYVSAQARSELAHLGDPPDRLSRWHKHMANLHLEGGRPTEAVDAMRQALQLASEADEPLYRAQVLHELAMLEVNVFEFDQADEHLRRARELIEAQLGPMHPDVAAVESSTGILEGGRGHWDEAQVHLEQAVRIHEATVGKKHPTYAMAAATLGDVLARKAEYDEAIPWLVEATTVSNETLGPSHSTTINARLRLARAYLEAGRADDALPEVEQAIEDARKALAAAHPYTASGLGILGDTYMALDRPDEAIAPMQEALAMQREIHGDGHTYVAEAHADLGRALVLAGRDDEALEHLSEAIEQSEGDELLDTEVPYYRYLRARAHYNLGRDRAGAIATAEQAAGELTDTAGADPMRAAEARDWVEAHR